MKWDFDGLVRQANEWLESPKGWRWSLENYVRGMLFMGRKPHPIYDNRLLTPWQKNAVMLASDVRRLDEGIEEEGRMKGEERRDELKAEQERLYNVFKSMF